jgi:hypothetical protein
MGVQVGPTAQLAYKAIVAFFAKYGMGLKLHAYPQREST